MYMNIGSSRYKQFGRLSWKHTKSCFFVPVGSVNQWHIWGSAFGQIHGNIRQNTANTIDSGQPNHGLYSISCSLNPEFWIKIREKDCSVQTRFITLVSFTSLTLRKPAASTESSRIFMRFSWINACPMCLSHEPLHTYVLHVVAHVEVPALAPRRKLEERQDQRKMAPDPLWEQSFLHGQRALAGQSFRRYQGA